MELDLADFPMSDDFFERRIRSAANFCIGYGPKKFSVGLPDCGASGQSALVPILQVMLRKCAPPFEMDSIENFFRFLFD